MITVSDELKAAFLCGNQKHLTLSFSDNTQQVDEDIYLESMEIEQSLCEEEQLTYGTVSAASFKVRILNSGKRFKGLGVNVSMSTIGDDEIEYTVSLGRYKVYDDVMSDDRNYRDLTCYDAFYGILDNEYADWYNNLSFPMTMKQFRDAFFSHVGLTQRTATLACDSVTIPANTVDSISGAIIIQSICEPSGAFCFIDYDGYVQYIVFGTKAGLYPRTDLYPRNDLYPRVAYDDVFDDTDPDAAPVQDGTVYGDYNCRRITQVTVARSSEKEYITVGVPGNTYQFATNPLLMYMDATTLESIGRTFLSVVSEVVYKPSRVKARARVWIQLGDMIGIMTQSDRLVLPVLHREMSGITALYDTYEAKGKEYYEFDANSLETRLNAVEDCIKDNSDDIVEINDDIDDINEEIDGEGGLKSRITTAEGEISLEVTRRTDADTALSSRLTVAEGQIELRVQKNDVINQINISTEGISIQGSKVNISGNTTFTATQADASSAKSATDGLSNGTTTIDGACIKTGTIDAARINLESESGNYKAALSGGGVKLYYYNGYYSQVGGITARASGGMEIDGWNGETYFANNNVRVANTLYVDGDFHVDDDSYFYAPTTSYEVNARVGTTEGHLVIGTNSSMRWKNSITTDISEELNPHKLYDIDVCQFKFNPDYLKMGDRRYNTPVIGFIAEDIAVKYPIACDYDELNIPENWNTRYIIPPMLKLIQEQHEQIELLKTKVAILEGGN